MRRLLPDAAAVARRDPQQKLPSRLCAARGLAARDTRPPNSAATSASTLSMFSLVSSSGALMCLRAAAVAQGLPFLVFRRAHPSRSSRNSRRTDMRRQSSLTAFALVIVAAITLAACASMTGKTAGENVDDATITSEVKAKLAAEKISTLTKISVDTERRTVYLTGNVDTPEMRAKAEEIARGVKHVAGVVNNLTVRAQ